MGTEMTAWHTGNAGVVILVTNIEEKGCAAIGFDVFAKQPGGIYPDTPEAAGYPEKEAGNAGIYP